MKNSNQMTGSRFVSVFLVCAIIAGAFTGCGKKEDEKSENNIEAVETPRLLTNVFRGEDIKTPDDEELSVSSNVDMQYSDGRIKMLLMKDEQIKTEDGGYSYKTYTYIYEAGIDGSDPVTTEIALEDKMYINSGAFTDDGIIFTTNTYDEKAKKQTYNLCKYKLEDSSITKLENLQHFFESAGDDWFYVNYMKVDSEGYIYLSFDSEVCVLNPDLTKAFSVTSPSHINSLEVSGEKAYVTGRFSDRIGICEIDKEKKAFGTELELPETISTSTFYFGEGYDIYYGFQQGLFGYNFGAEDGDLILDWQNSDISYTEVDKVNVLSKDMMMISYRDRDTLETTNAIFRRSADVDLSNIVVIEVAYVSRDYELPNKVSKFNRQNADKRVIMSDYSIYNSKENGYTGGETKLVTDIINGLYKPDIICDYNGNIISALNSNGLLRDLYSFMETDSDIKKDDIVGCVKNTYEHDGKLTAICPSFSVSTLLAKKSDVGDRTSWTLDEMLDFAMSLDSDKQLMDSVTSANADSSVLGVNPYIQFIDMDKNECDFNNPTFIKYLEFVAALPKEIDRSSSYDGNDNRYETYQTGKTMLYRASYSDVYNYQSDVVPFNTDEVVRIGFPTSDGVESGSYIRRAYSYSITSMSEKPDVAWSFLKTLIRTKAGGDFMSFDGISPLKSVNMASENNLKDQHSFYRFRGGTSSWSGDSDWYTLDENGRLNGEAGILVNFDKAKFDEFIDWLDNIGTPMKSSIPDGIINIINEEISTYVGGAKNAEDTAKVIQSRVSLWLAERS